MEGIDFCFERWARVVDPNENLADAFVKKAKNDLVVLRSIPVTDREWRAATAYYARYHMITAILLKIGVDCKDHNCSIRIAECLLSGMLPEIFFVEIKEAKSQRISLQYYTTRAIDETKFGQNLNGVGDFVDDAARFLDSLTRERVEAIRKKLVVGLRKS